MTRFLYREQPILSKIFDVSQQFGEILRNSTPVHKLVQNTAFEEAESQSLTCS